MSDQLNFFANTLANLPRTWTVQQLAALTGLTSVSIQNFARDGVIEKLGHGAYPFEAITILFTYYREKGGGKNINSPTHVTDRDLKTLKLEAENRKEQAIASLRELDLAERELTLLPADQVQKAIITLMDNFKAQLLSIPTSQGGMVRLAESDGEASALIKTAINHALHELTRFDVALAMAKAPILDESLDAPQLTPPHTANETTST